MTDTDPYADAIAHLVSADETLARIIARHGTCALSLESDLFRALARAIIGQQISVRAAAAVWSRVVALMDNGVVTPDGVLAVPDEHLRAAGLSWRKVGYLRDCAARFADGRIDPVALAAADDETILDALVAVKGVGRWTAEMVLIFSLGRRDILSTGDYGLRIAMQRHWGLAAPASPAEMEAIAANWRPYRSVASWYLWRSLSNGPITEEGESDRQAVELSRDEKK